MQAKIGNLAKIAYFEASGDGQAEIGDEIEGVGVGVDDMLQQVAVAPAGGGVRVVADGHVKGDVIVAEGVVEEFEQPRHLLEHDVDLRLVGHGHFQRGGSVSLHSERTAGAHGVDKYVSPAV